jgi:FkbM family methyltransferase
VSVYAVELVKQLVDCLANQAVTPLVVAGSEIEQVEEWLEDEASRRQYRHYLALRAACNVLDSSRAVHYLGNIKVDDENRTREHTIALLTSGILPALVFPQLHENDPNVYLYCMADTFVREQYRYGDLVAVSEGDVFIDCGACFGDTAVWAVRSGAGKVFAFEPWSQVLGALANNIQNFGQGCIELIPYGLSDVSGQSGIQAFTGNIGGTRLVDNDQDAVPVVTLDAWCRENAVKPDFIKMDIEGAEVNALKGAQSIITEYKPKLAICLYHNLSDMWEIPILIKKMVPDYRFWCRENHVGGEFVLYAAPRTV